MISAVTLNPCIDMTLILDKLYVGDHNVVARHRSDVSGKGINVNVVLNNLGADTKAVGFEFTRSGTPIGDFLADIGVPFEGMSLDHALRTNTKVFDSSTEQMTEINCKGPLLDPACVPELMRVFENSLEGTDILVVDGSVPPGIPDDIYLRMIETAKSRGIRTVLDATGPLLTLGIKACPDVIKPNKLELELLLDTTIGSMEQALDACRRLVAKGVGAVCLTLGEKGALLVNARGAWYSESLKVPVKSLQGAGDSLVAGLCMAMMENADPADMLRAGVTCALGSLLREGTLLCTREDYDRLYPLVPVKCIAGSAGSADSVG